MTQSKKCRICSLEKPLSEFYFSKHFYKGRTYSNPQAYCKLCTKAKSASRAKANPGTTREGSKKWRLENPERMKASIAKWQNANKAHLKEYRKNYHKKRMATDVNYRLAAILRNRFKAAFRKSYKIGSAVGNLDCSIDECRVHLEVQFQSGMSWANYGEWHIDHIIPLSAFDLSDPVQVEIAGHHLNLRPLWAKENISKGSKLDYSLMEEIIRAIAIKKGTYEPAT